MIGGNLELNHSANAIPGKLFIGDTAQTSTGTVTQNATGALSNQYPIINVVLGGASMGAFTSLNEGANLISTSGQTFRINYFAGIGNNDIYLTQLTASADLASQLSSITKLGNGGMFITGLGGTNGLYAILANTNVATTNWVSLGTVTAPNGLIQFTDLSATNHPMRFYRFQSR